MPKKDAILGAKKPPTSTAMELRARLAKGRATSVLNALSPEYTRRVERDKDLESSSPDWVAEAHDTKVRLPRYGQKVTTGGMRRWLKKIGVSVPQYLAWAGENDLKAFPKANPNWPMRSWAGLTLEHRELIKGDA